MRRTGPVREVDELEELRREAGRLRAELREASALRRRLAQTLGLDSGTDAAIVEAVERLHAGVEGAVLVDERVEDAVGHGQALAGSLSDMIDQAPEDVGPVTAALATTSQDAPRVVWAHIQQLKQLEADLNAAGSGRHRSVVWARRLLRRLGELRRDPVQRAATRGSRSPGRAAGRLEERAAVLTRLAACLRREATAVSWGNGEGNNRVRDLRDVGVHLVTKTKARRLGHRLKRGAFPVASMRFNAPINQDCDLYVLGVQTTLVSGAGR